MPAMRHLLFLVLLGSIALPVVGMADDPVTGDDVTQLLESLDDDRYEVRQEAATRLEAMVARPEVGPLLATEFQRVLVGGDVSFEVRWHLERWRKRLPDVPTEPIEGVSDEEIDRLIARMDDDSYAVRRAVVDRLRWLLGNPEQIGPIMIRSKRGLDDPSQDAEGTRRLSLLWQEARGAWLASDSVTIDLPHVSDEQIRRWVDDLARRAPASPRGDSWSVHERSERELLDLLARDDCIARVKGIIEDRLGGELENGEPGDVEPLDADATARLDNVLRWTRPAMVAEYWREGSHLGEQHLVIGVPSRTEGATAASHFDRIDDEVAHCVSGQNLTPGDYPVGVAIPHPRGGAIFHLINLPTPRRQLAYEYYVKLDETKRLRAISRRTLDRFLESKRLLDERELLMLAQLEANEVSRFAGKYFHLVNDSQLDSPGSARTSGRPSRFGVIALQLASNGTKEVMPGMIRAIDESAFLPPTSQCPYRFHWLAALSIARRDPWPASDTGPSAETWLAGLLRRDSLLVEDRPGGPELGATAAAVLLKSHGENPLSYGLRRAIDPLLARLGVDGYRYDSDEAPDRVAQWSKRFTEKTPLP